MKRLLIIFFLLTSGFAYADLLDSLEKVLKKHTKEDTTKVFLLNEIAWEQSYFDPALSIASANQALQVAKRINDESGEASAYNLLGINMRTQSKFEEAAQFFHKGIEIRKRQKNYTKVAALLLNLGNVHLANEKYSEAIALYKRVLFLCDSLKFDNPRSTVLVNLAMCFERSGDFKKALDYEFQALTLNRKMKDSLQEGYSLLTIAVTFHKQKQVDRSLDFLRQALKIFERTNNLDAIASCYNNLAIVYAHRSNYDESLKAYQKALDIYQKMGAVNSAALILHNIGSAYEYMKDYENSILYQKKSLSAISPEQDIELFTQASLSLFEVYKKLNDRKNASGFATQAYSHINELDNPSLLSTVYEAMAVVQSWNGNYREAFRFQELVTELKDSLYTNEATRQMAQMEAIYETEKKEKEITLLTKEKEVQNEKIARQQVLNYSIGGGLLLLGGMSLLMYSRYRDKKKSNLELQNKNEAITLQKQEIEFQHSIIESKNKDITDSINYAKRIQSSFLPAQLLAEKILPEHFILYRPKDIVSGDFYWIGNNRELGEKRFLLATADCTGHGVPGAFMSIIGVSLLNEIVLKRGVYQTDIILNELRTGIIKAVNPEGSEIEAKDGMDISLCFFDLEKMTLSYSGANNSIWIVRQQGEEKQLIELKADKFPVGKSHYEETSFSMQTLDLIKGDLVYTFSDGYADQFGGPQGKKFKKKQLQDLITGFIVSDMKNQQSLLEEALNIWQGSHEQIDDICVIGIKI